MPFLSFTLAFRNQYMADEILSCLWDEYIAMSLVIGRAQCRQFRFETIQCGPIDLFELSNSRYGRKYCYRCSR